MPSAPIASAPVEDDAIVPTTTTPPARVRDDADRAEAVLPGGPAETHTRNTAVEHSADDSFFADAPAPERSPSPAARGSPMLDVPVRSETNAVGDATTAVAAAVAVVVDGDAATVSVTETAPRANNAEKRRVNVLPAAADDDDAHSNVSVHLHNKRTDGDDDDDDDDGDDDGDDAKTSAKQLKNVLPRKPMVCGVGCV
jgi:hypothetical protein